MDKIKESVFAIVGTLLIISSLVVAKHTKELIENSIVVAGKVTELNAGGSHPEIEYTTLKSETFFYPQGGFIGSYKIGDYVRVHYNPSDPQLSTTLDVFGAIWAWSLISGVLGVSFSAFGLIALLRPGLAKEIFHDS